MDEYRTWPRACGISLDRSTYPARQRYDNNHLIHIHTVGTCQYQRLPLYHIQSSLVVTLLFFYFLQPLLPPPPVAVMLSFLNSLSTAFLVCLLLFGSFTRFTRGSYLLTHSFHAYQRDRNSDEHLMDTIASIDLVLSTLLLPRLTRSLSALLITAAMSAGLYMRVVKERKDATIDVALTGVALFVLVSSVLVGRSSQSAAHQKSS